MSDRKPKPNTTIYLFRDIPDARLKLAQAALQADGTTLKQALLQTVERLARKQERRRKARKGTATAAA